MDAKLIKYPGHAEWTELFDLTNDPYEIKNPENDLKQRKLLTEMTAEFDKQVKATSYTVPEHADQPGSVNARPAANKGKATKAAAEKEWSFLVTTLASPWRTEIGRMLVFLRG